jgi:hypothetical protein
MMAIVIEVPPAGLRLANASSEAVRCPHDVSWSRFRTLRLKLIYAWSQRLPSLGLVTTASKWGFRRRDTRCWLLICWSASYDEDKALRDGWMIRSLLSINFFNPISWHHTYVV